MSIQLQKGLSFQKGLPFPKGIINIISDYAHTLFYIDELKDKTGDIYDTTMWNIYDLSCIYCGFQIVGGIFRFTNRTGHYGDIRYGLLEKENERRSVFGIKKEKSLWSKEYNRNYQSY